MHLPSQTNQDAETGHIAPGGKVSRTRAAGPDHQVITIEGGRDGYQVRPCATCPWRKDAVGEFPAEAFRHSAETAYDMARQQFACHSAGAERPKTCAGYLLRGADHNLAHRLDVMRGRVEPDLVRDGGHELWSSYREMAIANGVDPDDPVLAKCREP